MPTPSELLQALHSTLTASLEHLAFFDDAEGKSKAAQAQLAATLKEYDMAATRLRNVKLELAKAEESLASKRHLINEEAARALQDTNRQITERNEELKKINADIADKRAEQENILKGMQALSQRLRV